MEVHKGPFQEEVVFLQGSVHFHVSWWEGNENATGLKMFPRSVFDNWEQTMLHA